MQQINQFWADLEKVQFTRKNFLLKCNLNIQVCNTSILESFRYHNLLPLYFITKICFVWVFLNSEFMCLFETLLKLGVFWLWDRFGISLLSSCLSLALSFTLEWPCAIFHLFPFPKTQTHFFSAKSPFIQSVRKEGNDDEIREWFTKKNAESIQLIFLDYVL